MNKNCLRWGDCTKGGQTLGIAGGSAGFDWCPALRIIFKSGLKALASVLHTFIPSKLTRRSQNLQHGDCWNLSWAIIKSIFSMEFSPLSQIVTSLFLWRCCDLGGVEPIEIISARCQLCESCALFTQSWLFATGQAPQPQLCCPLLAHLESIPFPQCGLGVVLTSCHCSFLDASELYDHSQELNPTFARSDHYLACTSPMIAMSRPPVRWNSGNILKCRHCC